MEHKRPDLQSREARVRAGAEAACRIRHGYPEKIKQGARQAAAQVNPAIDPTVLTWEFRRSEETFRREYLAEFTDSIEGWISPTLLDQCVVRNRSDLPFQPG
jgi:hypothetical protein